MKKSNTIVIALGGSLIVPNDIDTAFLKRFRKLLFEEIEKGKKFVIIAGGGKTARMYNDAVVKVVKPTTDDLDWMGIQSTRLNAELLRIIFKDRVNVVGGTKPGWSTDHAAMEHAKKFGTKEVIIAGDISFVYNRDPKKFKNAKVLKELTWSEYQKLIPKKWKPGLSTPVDPIAARFAKKNGVTVKIIKGTNLLNFKRAIEDKSFRGTLITPES